MSHLQILHVHSGNLFGGIETVLLSLTRFQDGKDGFESEYALCHDARLASELRSAAASVHILPQARASRPWSVRSSRKQLAVILNGSQYDAVVCHSPWAQGIYGPVTLRAKPASVFWLHGALSKSHWTERLARRYPPRLVICNSRFTQESVADLYPAVRSSVVYNPVAPAAPVAPVAARDSRRPELRSEVRQRLDTPANAFVLLLVGRMEELKGHPALLSATAELCSTRDVYCWIVGGPQRHAERRYLSKLTGMAADLGIEGRVRFLGERTDVSDLYASADLYCQPNTKPEGFGVTFVEALYAGLPVVTTKLGGALEIVDESCGELVEPGSVHGLVETIQSLADRPERLRELAHAAPGRAKQLCDPLRQLARVYREVKSLAA